MNLRGGVIDPALIRTYNNMDPNELLNVLHDLLQDNGMLDIIINNLVNRREAIRTIDLCDTIIYVALNRNLITQTEYNRYVRKINRYRWRYVRRTPPNRLAGKSYDTLVGMGKDKKNKKSSESSSSSEDYVPSLNPARYNDKSDLYLPRPPTYRSSSHSLTAVPQEYLSDTEWNPPLTSKVKIDSGKLLDKFNSYFILEKDKVILVKPMNHNLVLYNKLYQLLIDLYYKKNVIPKENILYGIYLLNTEAKKTFHYYFSVMGDEVTLKSGYLDNKHSYSSIKFFLDYLYEMKVINKKQYYNAMDQVSNKYHHYSNPKNKLSSLLTREDFDRFFPTIHGVMRYVMPNVLPDELVEIHLLTLQISEIITDEEYKMAISLIR